MVRLALLIILLLLSILLHAQNQTNVWYFGGNNTDFFNVGDPVGLDFSSGQPAILKDGLLISREVATSISDDNGNLLFYSDGVVVMNRFHDTMPNGTGLTSNVSTTQGALVVPHPGNSNLFYLFALDNEGGPDGLNVSLVDMTADNGRGDVVQKNKNLLSRTTEKISAVHHQNGKDIWVVAHGFMNNNFHAFLITENGLNETPVTTGIGPVHGIAEHDAWATIGNMRLSHCGKHLALVRYGGEIVDIFRFDNCNGVVYDHLAISSPDPMLNFNNGYGLEFSPDDSKLYFGTFQGGQLFQLSLEEYSAEAIRNSAVEIGRCNCTTMGDLQLAPDGNIYVTYENRGSLGVIENPNERPPFASYTVNALTIDTSQVLTLALPDFVQSLVYRGDCNAAITNGAFLGNDTTLCFGDNLLLNVAGQGTDFLWQDGSMGSDFLVTAPGEYFVEVFVSGCIQLYDTIQVEYSSFGADGIRMEDTTMCPGLPVTLDATAPGAISYRWDNNSNDATRTVNSPGEYWVRITDGLCRFFDTVTVTLADELPPDNNYLSDTALCKGSALSISIDADDASVLWSDGSEEADRLLLSPGFYRVTVSNACGSVKDSMRISHTNCDDDCLLYFPNAFSPGNDDLNERITLVPTCPLTDFEMLVFNRWGQLLFKTNDLNEGWDGTYQGVMSPMGMYMAIVKIRSQQGETERSFMFTLLR